MFSFQTQMCTNMYYSNENVASDIKLMELQYQLSPCLSYISYMDGWENLYCELKSERVKKGKINIHKHPLFYLHQERQTFWGFRFDMSKPQDYYWSDHIVRTLHDVKECVKKKQYSCAHQPLLDISLENVVLDELHLMLRVTGEMFLVPIRL